MPGGGRSVAQRQDEESVGALTYLWHLAGFALFRLDS